MNELGKIPPQSIELEEAVLGALLLEKESIFDVIDILTPEHFYKESHNAIFRTIQTLYRENRSIDLLTVAEALKTANLLEAVGGRLYIAQLTNKVASSAHISTHAKKLVELYIKRGCINISYELQHDAFNDSTDAFEVLDATERKIGSLTSNINKKQSKRISEAIYSYLEHLNSPNKTNGITSGFSAIDRITGGWQKSELIVLAARPGMGKTAIALNFATHAGVTNGKKILFFSLEMGEMQLIQRLISEQTDIYSDKLKHKNLNQLDWQKLGTKLEDAIKSNIFINDQAYCDLSYLKSTARKMHHQHGLDMIIIDYLQLIKGAATYKGNREQEISEISRNLKALAKELNIPIIALSQLSREVEKRGDKKPQLSDLRESGAIEQDADIICFLMRPEYYKVQSINWNGTDLSTNGIAIFDIAKNRNGATGEELIRCDLSVSRFSNYDENVF